MKGGHSQFPQRVLVDLICTDWWGPALVAECRVWMGETAVGWRRGRERGRRGEEEGGEWREENGGRGGGRGGEEGRREGRREGNGGRGKREGGEEDICKEHAMVELHSWTIRHDRGGGEF